MPVKMITVTILGAWQANTHDNVILPKTQLPIATAKNIIVDKCLPASDAFATGWSISVSAGENDK